MAKRAKKLGATGLISGLTLDPENRRRRTARGARMLVEALGQVGPARSIVIDEHDEVLAGNGVVVAAQEVGLTKLLVVEPDPDTLVAVRRRNLTPEQKRAVAMYDNRAGELAEWDAEQLAADKAQGRELTPWFDDQELRKHLRASAGLPISVKELPTTDVGDEFWIAIRGPLKSQAIALQKLRELMQEIEGVQVELGTIQQEAWTG